YTTIDPPNSLFTVAYGINASGQVVGLYFDANFFNFHSFLLSSGQYTILPADPNAYPATTVAYGINNPGQILATNCTPHTSGFLLSGGQYTTFDPPNSTFTQPTGINDRGQIVGFYQYNNGAFLGFLADPVPGNSAADPASSPAPASVPDPAIATPSVVLVTV